MATPPEPDSEEVADLCQSIPEIYIPIIKSLWQKINHSGECRGDDFSSKDIDGYPNAPFLAGLKWLENNKFVFRTNSLIGNPPKHMYFLHIGHNGVLFMQNYKSQSVPASDRFVSRSDNESSANLAVGTLRELMNNIRTSNEFSADSDQRIALSIEVNALTELIGQSKIRVASIKNAITGSGILNWLATHTADATINVLALEAIQHLTKLCGFG